MAFVTMYEGVVFIEGAHPRAIKHHNADTRVGGFGAQLPAQDYGSIKAQLVR